MTAWPSELLGTRQRNLSGTEPVLRVMVEAQGVDEAVHHAETIAGVVKQATA